MVARSTSSLMSPCGSTSRTEDTKQDSKIISKCAKVRSCQSSAVQPPDKRKRLAANARERKRMHLLNRAYDKLRKRLADAENKSKYDVLVQAKEYIQALASICENFDRQHPNQAKVPATQLVLAPPTQAPDDSGRPEMTLNPDTPQSQTTVAYQQPIDEPLTPVMAKLESPQSVASSSIGDCFSPMSQPESVISNCSATTQIITADNFDGNKSLHRRTHHYIESAFQQPLQREALSCSTLLSPPPFMPLPYTHFAPHSRKMQQLAHDYLPKIEPYFTKQAQAQVHSNQQVAAHSLMATTTTNQNLYNQYYRTFQCQIQRAT